MACTYDRVVLVVLVLAHELAHPRRRGHELTRRLRRVRVRVGVSVSVSVIGVSVPGVMSVRVSVSIM